MIGELIRYISLGAMIVLIIIGIIVIIKLRAFSRMLDDARDVDVNEKDDDKNK